MDEHDLRELIDGLRHGTVSPDDALSRLRALPFADLGFARVDHHRGLRQGMPEAVYGPGKTPEQCALIVKELLTNGSGPVIATRLDDDQLEAVLKSAPGGFVTDVKVGARPLHLVSYRHGPSLSRSVVIVTAGTADLPVALECQATLCAYGIEPVLCADCGVSGVHRILAVAPELAAADAVVVVAGMEGALASVVGGLTPAPVVAVPTSTGYGAGLDGVTALLAMHASCASGVSVVGIDNGFGAACAVMRLVSVTRRAPGDDRR